MGRGKVVNAITCGDEIEAVIPLEVVRGLRYEANTILYTCTRSSLTSLSNRLRIRIEPNDLAFSERLRDRNANSPTPQPTSSTRPPFSNRWMTSGSFVSQ